MLLQSFCFFVPTPCRTRRFWLPETSEKDVFLRRGDKGLGIVVQERKGLAFFFFPLSPFKH